MAHPIGRRPALKDAGRHQTFSLLSRWRQEFRIKAEVMHQVAARRKRSLRLLAAMLPVGVLVLGACAATETPAGPDEARGALTAAQADALSDEFSGITLDPSWSVVNGAAAALSVHNGALHVVATRSSLWFNAAHGVLVYKLVPGDFKATVTVHTRKASDRTMPPDQPIELGGIMARDPGMASENWIFIVNGFGEQGHIAVEHKNTVASASVFAESPFTPDAELRLCRVGANISLYKRPVGSRSWGAPDLQVTRTDFGPTLQVGPNMYASETTPDLDAFFDRVTFAAVASVADCTTDTAPAPNVPAVPGVVFVVMAGGIVVVALVRLRLRRAGVLRSSG
jgi:hypothetical protein